jgi:hypothetical protein
MHSLPKSVAVVRPQRPVPFAQRPVARVRSLPPELEWLPVFGKTVTLFVGFTAALNWLHYRKARKRIEDARTEERNDD